MDKTRDVSDVVNK